MQPRDDFLSRERIRSRGQRDPRHARKRSARTARRMYSGGVMAPLRHAVGFVDCEQGEPEAASRSRQRSVRRRSGAT